MALKEDFDKAAEDAKTQVPPKAANADKLALYGLFKQATTGDVDTGKPGIFDQKGRAKWEAWEKQKGKDKETAMKEYIALVEELTAKYATEVATAI
ncbi:hypothetical protein WJX75_003760 [Coccomyxa subellipsoidea]|uniref:ACB domain-containing protein n=1 Tax=Coccomyxa subellipsoidea TaxID=248742 RepID=A0ABR2Z2R6_9CHLO